MTAPREAGRAVLRVGQRVCVVAASSFFDGREGTVVALHDHSDGERCVRVRLDYSIAVGDTFWFAPDELAALSPSEDGGPSDG